MGRVTLADLMVASDKTYRIFLLGAGFSKPAGMPLAAELLPLIEGAARDYMSVDGYNVVVELRGLEPLTPTLPVRFTVFVDVRRRGKAYCIRVSSKRRMSANDVAHDRRLPNWLPK